MNTNSKVLLGATIGGALGWFVGSVVAEIIALKEWEAEHADEIDDWVDGTENDPIDEIDSEKVTYQRPKQMGKNKVVRNYSEQFKKNPALEQLVKKYNGEEDPTGISEQIHEKVVELAIEEFEYPEDDNVQPISIISMEEYANAEGFQYVMLNYYEDDVVTDDHDNPIDHPEQIIGDDALVSFGELSEDEDVVYVRNLPKKAMYEIVRTNKEYAAPNPKAQRLAMKEKMRRDRIDSMGDSQNDN